MISGTDLLAIASGSLVGTILGVIGGGGSILAVPLLVYVVGVTSPHIAIGTSALAVSASALANLIGHARAKHVRWSCALVFSIAGVTGASLGSIVGKSIGGEKLLVLFGVLMIVVAIMMVVKKTPEAADFQPLCKETAAVLLPRLAGIGVAAGFLSGFFGIGGGFLIVPGLMLAARMPVILAIGSSLLAVTLFGLTTAISYAWSGLIDWRIAADFIAGGVMGSLVGTALAKHLSQYKGALTRSFAGTVVLVGVYIIVKGVAKMS